MASAAEINERTIRASRLFGALDAPLVQELARSATRKRYVRGDAVWRAGDVPASFTIIAAGLVKIVRTLPDGAESIVAIFGPRESIGDAAVLGRRPYPADAIAASGVIEVVRVDAAPVLAAFARDPQVAAAIQDSLLEHTRALQEKIRIMSAGAVPKRLATLLLHLAERFGDEAEDGATIVPIALSRAELAKLVGATVETTIRAMSKWQKEGLVGTTPEGFRLHDVAKLDAITRASE